MVKFWILLSSLCLLCHLAMAQEQATPQTAAPSTPTSDSKDATNAASTTAKATVKKATSPWLLSGRTLLWQEIAMATENSTRSEFQAQFMGFALGTVYHRNLSPRYLQWHTLNIMTGSAHITGKSGGYNDNLKNQSWHGAVFSPGILYRTSKATDVGLSFPLIYRSIKWVIQRDTLSIDTHSSTTYGINLMTRYRLGSGNYTVVAELGQMHDWSGALWQLGLDYKF